MRKGLLLVGLALALLAGCAEAGGERVRINLWPLLFYQSSPDGSVQELELLGPFLYEYRTREESGSSIRPLISGVNRASGCRDIYYLSPLGTHSSCPTYTRSYFVPLLGATSNDLRQDERRDRSEHHMFLLFAWGRSREGERYFGLFPLYGRFLDWRGKDETRFVLWPLRLTSRWEGNRSSTWLWPIYNRTQGPTVNGIKFWPLYGHRTKEGAYDRTFVLWPFFWHERFNFHAHETTRDMFFPLWIEEQSEVHERYVLLWPFFRHYRNHEDGTVSWDLPWPFFRYGEGPKTGYRERKLWPLIGYRREEGSYSHFFLWPLYRYERHRVEHGGRVFLKESRRFYLLSRLERAWDEDGRVRYEFARIWPLGEQFKRDDGFEYFYFPALIPFHSEGIDRNIAPLLRLYEYVRDPRGFTHSKWFWGLYRHDEGDEEEFVDLAFLLNYHRRQRDWELKFLFGLLKIGKRDGRFRFGLLFLDLI